MIKDFEQWEKLLGICRKEEFRQVQIKEGTELAFWIRSFLLQYLQ